MKYQAVLTLFYKETLRFYKVLLQTIIAPIVTTLLFFLVFSHVMEKNITVYGGVSYSSFLIPGLIMMSVLQNSFANSSSSFIQSKVSGNIVFVLLAPLAHFELFLAYVMAAVLRGMVVGLGVFLVTLLFVPFHIHSVAYLLVFALIGSAILGTMGIIAGIWADKFDQLAGFQNFIILPLTFLSGVFYSIHTLPAFWQKLSFLNPFFYLIDGFRYAFIGHSDVAPGLSLLFAFLTLIVLSLLTIMLLKIGYKLRH
ncbi:MAG: ABC transporter permease [Gammaproteobacteria bacterium]